MQALNPAPATRAPSTRWSAWSSWSTAGRTWLPLLLVAAMGCAGSAAGIRSNSAQSSPAAPGERAGASWSEETTAAPTSVVEEAPPERSAARPGLATHWGESVRSDVHTTDFERADPTRPLATASLWYNDERGAAAMASHAGYLRDQVASVPFSEANVSVTLVDGQGRLLPAYRVGDRVYAVGQPGQRYAIEIVNRTPARFEVVVSVDGLDVLDGKPASYDKRGYLLAPYGHLSIDGFRQSTSSVAAFRFGDVRGSYASRSTGDARNVGVVGIAVFHEAGSMPGSWDPDEVRRRERADPFPGRFAAPPP